MVTSICEMHVHAALFCAGIGTKGIDTIDFLDHISLQDRYF